MRRNKKDDEAAAGNPYDHLDKATVVQETRAFNETPVNARKCRPILCKLLYLLQHGETIGKTEATDTFFAITKLWQAKDMTLRMLVYLAIKELCQMSSDVIIVTSSLTKDMTGREDVYRAPAIRALCRILTDTGMLQVVCRWANNVQEPVSTDNHMVQFHALSLLAQIRSIDRLAILKMVQKFSRMFVYKEFADGALKLYEKAHHVHEQPIRPNRRHFKNALSRRIKMSRIKYRRRERLRRKLRGDVKAVVQSMVTLVVHQLDGVEILKQIVVEKKHNDVDDDAVGAGRKRKRRQKMKSGGRQRRRTQVQTQSAKRSKMDDGGGGSRGDDDGIEAGGSGDCVSQWMGAAYLLDSLSDEAAAATSSVEQRAAVGPQRERSRRASSLGIGTKVGTYLDSSSSSLADKAKVCADEEVDNALNVPLADDVGVAFHACPCPDQLLEDDPDKENDAGRGEERIDQPENIEKAVHNVDIVSERDDDDDDRPLLSTPNAPTNEERDRQMLFAVGMCASPVIEITNFEGIAMRRSFKVDPEDVNKDMINNNCELVVGEEDLPDDRTLMQMERSNTVNNRSRGRSSNKTKRKMITIINHRGKGSTGVRKAKAVKLIREKGMGMEKNKKKPVHKRLPLKRSGEQSTKSRKENVVVRKKLRTTITTVQPATKTTSHTQEELKQHTAVADHQHPIDHRRPLTQSASSAHQQQQHNSISPADDLLCQLGFGTVVIQQPIFSLSDADTMAMLKQIGAEQRVSLVERSGSFLFIPPKGSVHYLGGKLLALTHSTDHIRVDEFCEGNLVGTVERWPRTIDALPLFIKHLHRKLFVFFA
uniref:Adaptin_N domain-containing protein n=1 Tax=Globodera pallida TaxID=36090 RepID=A0A183BZE3_GLOPA